MTTRRRTVLVALLCAAAACGTDPTPLNLAGRWSGATNDGGTDVTLTLTHNLSSNQLSGSWTVKLGSSVSFSGTVDGRLSNRSVTLALHHEVRSSLFTYTGTVADDGMLLNGTFRDADGRTVRLELTKE